MRNPTMGEFAVGQSAGSTPIRGSWEIGLRGSWEIGLRGSWEIGLRGSWEIG